MATDSGRATRIVGVVLCVLALSAAPASPQSCYGEMVAARSYAVGSYPRGIAVADFDSDGIPDLAVANGGASSTGPGVSILLGNGDATFVPGSDIKGLASPQYLATADVNNDGATDLAVAQGMGDVIVLLGDGVGAFTQAGTFGTPPAAWIAAGHLNRDGNVDLVTAGRWNGSVSVLLGSGSGGFTLTGTIPAGSAPFAVFITDLDVDARNDLLTGNDDGSIAFLKGDGAGGFQPPVTQSTGLSSAAGMGVGLIDGDPYVDVAMSGEPGSPGLVSVLLGTGGGSLQTPRVFWAHFQPGALVIADVDADRKADVVVAGYDHLDILLGDGTGNLGSATKLTSGYEPRVPISADFDGDGVTDVAVTCQSMQVVVARGRAGAMPTTTYDPGLFSPDGLVALDADADGDRDLVVMDGSQRLVMMTNDGAGALQAGTPFGGGPGASGRDLISGDWNGDGLLDLAVTDIVQDEVAIYMAQPGGVFAGPTTYATDNEPAALAAADFNGDGKVDLVTANVWLTASILMGIGTGTFQPAINVSIPGLSTQSVVARDLDGDGLADLAVCRFTPQDVAILIGNGDGTFQPPVGINLGTGSSPAAIASGFFNGDALADLAVVQSGYNVASFLSVLLGNGNGTFQAPVTYPMLFGPTQIVALDVNGKGTQDLAISFWADYEITLMSSSINGQITALASYAMGAPYGLCAADLNGDDAPDLAVANGCCSNQTVSVALTVGPRIVPGSLAPGFVGAAYAQTLTLVGGAMPVTFALAGGALPSGLALSTAGLISGTPDAAGSSSFVVKATDASGCTASRSYAIAIDGKILYLVGQGLGPPNANRVRLEGQRGGVAVEFLSYGGGQWGVNVASGNIDGGAYDEILTGPGPGAVYGPQVRAFTRAGAPIAKVNFYAYGTLRYGANVGSGRIDGDGYGEILSGAGPGAVFGPHVRGFNFDGASLTPIAKVSYFAYSTLKYGVNVTAGDLDADGYGEIGTGAGPGTVFGSHVRGFNFDGASVTSMGKISFFAFSYSGYGANVALGDVEGDGFDEIAASPGPGPGHPCRFEGFNYDGASIASLIGFDVTRSGSLYGGRVAAGDVSGDGNADLVTGLGRDPSAAAMLLSYSYDGTALTATGAAFAAFPGTYGVNVAWGTFD